MFSRVIESHREPVDKVLFIGVQMKRVRSHIDAIDADATQLAALLLRLRVARATRLVAVFWARRRVLLVTAASLLLLLLLRLWRLRLLLQHAVVAVRVDDLALDTAGCCVCARFTGFRFVLLATRTVLLVSLVVRQHPFRSHADC